MITLHEDGLKQVMASGMDEPLRQTIKTEFSASLSVIQKRFEGKPIKIILSNWEGDNIVYCGAVARFIKSSEFAQRCDGADGQGIERRLVRFGEWVELRDSAIQDIKRRHPNLDVEQAPEFNIANLHPERCVQSCDEKSTVLNFLAAQGSRPLCSYSSYNSINTGMLSQDLPKILQICDKVILGEVGFGNKQRGSLGVTQGYAKVAEAVAANRDRISAVVFWNAFSRGQSAAPEDSFGLYNDDGSLENLRYLPAELRPLQLSPTRE
jgi:hypothetical protein